MVTVKAFYSARLHIRVCIKNIDETATNGIVLIILHVHFFKARYNRSPL